jgi:Golgi apparatus protein 1
LAAALALTPLATYGAETKTAALGEISPDRTQKATPQMGTGETGDRGELEALMDRLSQSQLRGRIDSAIEQVESACAGDVEDFCGSVTPGEGRIALCMRAHSDQLSRRCRISLFRVAQNLKQSISSTAEECLNAIKAQCGDAPKVGDCAEQKAASLSPGCQSIVAALRQVGQRLAVLKGMRVFSADDKDIGQIVDVTRAPDGQIQSVQVNLGRFLGIGDRVVTIGADKIQEMRDRLKLRMSSDELRTLSQRG